MATPPTGPSCSAQPGLCLERPSPQPVLWQLQDQCFSTASSLWVHLLDPLGLGAALAFLSVAH